MTSRIARIWLITVMSAALACALVTWVTSGFVWQFSTFRISLRDPFRPIVVAVLCGVGLRWIAADSVAIFVDRAQRTLMNRTGLLTLALCLAVVVGGIRSGTHVAGGSDSFGYVSQADLWLSGDLRIDQRSLQLPAPFGDFALAPLGYRPGPEPHTIVPTYPPGLPLLMAALKWVGGADGPYYVVPLLGGLLIAWTFLLGRRLFDEGVGLAASLLLAASPAFLNQLMVPMSDVPAAAAWTLALVLSVGGRSLAAGLASSLAIVIRPNLAPLALGVAVISIGVGLRTRQQEQRRWIRTLLFAGGAALGVLGIAVLNANLYGSPLASGYGSASTIYDWRNLRLNLQRYPRWLIETQTPFIIVGVLPLLGRWWERSRPSIAGMTGRIGLAVYLVALFAGYFLYMPFEHWSYLRFLLPAFPVLLILAVGALRSLGPRLGRADQVAVTTAVVALVLGWELSTGLWRGVFSQREPEQWYVTIAREARMIAPADAVFLCLQHSGSVRFYGDRLTVRYDAIEAGSLDRAIEILHAKGFHPYFLLDGWEEPRFQARFGQASAMGRLDWNPVRRWNSPTHAALYDSAAATPR